MEYTIPISDTELSNLIGLSEYQIKKYNKELIKKGYLQINKDNNGNELKIFKINK